MESAALFAFYVHLHSLDHFQCTAARIPKYVCVGIYGWLKVTDREAIWHGSWSQWRYEVRFPLCQFSCRAWTGEGGGLLRPLRAAVVGSIPCGVGRVPG